MTLPAVWIDNDQLIVKQHFSRFGGYSGSYIYRADGTERTAVGLPELYYDEVQVLPPDRIYSRGVIYSVKKGATYWKIGPTYAPTLGITSVVSAVVGSLVVFEYGPYLMGTTHSTAP